MALLIVVYHFSYWMDIDYLNPFLKTYGRYGVSIFYILSGFTLQYIYGQRLSSLPSLKNYFKKRFFRIYPLLLFVTITTYAILLFSKKETFSAWRLIENIFLLFPFINWSNPIATGSWSIGNEVIFYLIFGGLSIIRSQRFKIIITSILFLLSTLFGVVYFSVDMHEMTVNSWEIYTNPLFQLKFFLIGVLLFELYNFYKTTALKLLKYLGYLKWFLLIIGLLLSLLTNEMNIILGKVGNFLLLHSVILFISFINDEHDSQGIIPKFLFKMGTISYSVYLCHPLVYAFYKGFNLDTYSLGIFPRWLSLVLLIIATLTLSTITYKRIEQKFKI